MDNNPSGYLTEEELEELYDIEEQDWLDGNEEPYCGCKYCICLNKTLAGETCSDCLHGAHQG